MAVTPEDIAVELGRTVPETASAEYAQWELWITDARMLINARLGDLTALDQERLDYVVRQAVVEHIKHPDDATQVTVAVDDASTSRMYRSGAGRVRIREEWWDLLSPNTKAGAFSIFPARSSSGHAPWCDLMFLGADCSCGHSLSGGPWIYEPDVYS